MKTLEILSDKDLMKQIEVANGLRSPNMVVVVWETWLNSGAEAEGLGLTRQIWSDMQRFDGYISHQLLVDNDTPSHLLVVSQWRSREVADRIKEEYAGSVI